jgi:D-serine deaminase-like pyridoxal phosphate-dependent protein
VSEAEAMVNGGVGDVLLTNEIVGDPKMQRLGALATQAKVGICADDHFHVTAYERAARQYGAEIDVYIEINVGSDRCGILPGDAMIAMARRIGASKYLRFAGLQAYCGYVQHQRAYLDRKKIIEEAARRTESAIDRLNENGIACNTVTGAGTGSFEIEIDRGVLNEIQAGSYIFMDVDYSKNLDEDGKACDAFKQSLFVYTTVMSCPTAERAIVDAGIKAVALDSGVPVISGMDDVAYVPGGDEHGTLMTGSAACAPKIGDKLKLVPGHCDPTVNLYDWYVGVRNDRVEALWPITARGALL